MDKAVNPTSVMGTSKLVGERLITAAAAQDSRDGPVFAATRFGNVLGSNGSVAPIFARQIAPGGPITLTDRAMNRFVMTIDEAVELVLETIARAQGGEIFVTKMHAIGIQHPQYQPHQPRSSSVALDPLPIGVTQSPHSPFSPQILHPPSHRVILGCLLLLGDYYPLPGHVFGP